jgi:dTDP-4-dehydrorhamnose reductase
MTPTILLTGKSGQIGFELYRLLPQVGKLVAPDRTQLNLLDHQSTRQTIREVRPQLVVNAAAYTAVDAAEKDPVNAYAINAEAVRVLAEETKRIGAVLVHYSTDYVFDGSKKDPYEEHDSTNPLNVYGKSKLAGEQAIHDSTVSHLIFRTAWVYAARGKNFLLTILRLATERQEIRVVSDQIGAPTCASEIAAGTTRILAQLNNSNDREFAVSRVTGTYHMTATGQTSWCDFAESILRHAKSESTRSSWMTAALQDRAIIARQIVPIPTREFPLPAQRPPYSVLSNRLLLDTFGVALPHWRLQLDHCFSPEDSDTQMQCS